MNADDFILSPPKSEDTSKWCYAATTGAQSESSSKYYYGNSQLNAAVTSSTETLFYSLVTCGSAPQVIDGDEIISLTTTIRSNPESSMQGGVFVNAVMLSVDIICSYYATVDTFISIETLEIDSLVDDKK